MSAVSVSVSGEFIPFDMTPTNFFDSFKTGELLTADYRVVRITELPSPAPKPAPVYPKSDEVDPWMGKEAHDAYMRALLGF